MTAPLKCMGMLLYMNGMDGLFGGRAPALSIRRFSSPLLLLSFAFSLSFSPLPSAPTAPPHLNHKLNTPVILRRTSNFPHNTRRSPERPLRPSSAPCLDSSTYRPFTSVDPRSTCHTRPSPPRDSSSMTGPAAELPWLAGGAWRSVRVPCGEALSLEVCQSEVVAPWLLGSRVWICYVCDLQLQVASLAF